MMPDPASPYAGARTVVLGASGFIGRWVASRLSEAGADVHAIVRRADSMERLLGPYAIRATVHVLDLRDLDALRRVLIDVRPAATFNLAGYGVDRQERDEVEARRLNAALPPELCGMIASTRDPAWPGIALVHVGTALEYGRADGHLDEEGPALPTTLYGRTKLDGVLALRKRAEASGTPTVTARLFTVYGPGEHPGRLLPSLCAAARGTESLPLTAGRQRRDFTFVDDAADGLLRLAAAPGPGNVIVNLATGALTSVRTFVEVAARILRIAPERLGFGELPARPEEMTHAEVTVDRLRRLVGWVPSVAIEEGIRRTVEFLNAHEDLAVS